MNSLKRLVWLAFIVVSVLLGAIVLLGAYQYRLAGSYNRVISQNERVLFHYMTIREAITESLVSGNWSRLDRIVDDLEKLNRDLNRLKENKLISAQLKLALVDKIDLTGLTILLRQVEHDTKQNDRRKRLQEQLRAISDYLIQYDRIIAGQARERIVNFQTVVIGALGLIISLASISLILLYRNTVSPLIKLSQIVKEDKLVGGNIKINQPVVSEISALVDSLEELVGMSDQAEGGAGDEEHLQAAEALLGEAVNETMNRLNGIINYAQLLYDSFGDSAESEEHRAMLQKIMESGSEIAGEWQKLK